MTAHLFFAFLLGMALGVLAGAVMVGTLLDWLDRRIDAATTLPPRHEEAATERIRPANVADLPRRRERLDEWL